jgi:uridine kinase
LHFISSATQHSRRIQQFKSYTAREIIDLLELRGATIILQHLSYYKRKDKTQSNYQLWQEGTHPEEMSDERMLQQRLEYIHNNPVERGYVDLPEHWRYSSARNYMGQAGLIPVDVLT